MTTITHADIENMSVAELATNLLLWNEAYRSGEEIVPNVIYDFAEARYREMNGGADIVAKPAPTPVGDKKFRHVVPMLSTKNAFTADDVQAFIKRIEKANIDAEQVVIRATSKLDGVSGYLQREPQVLATRGENGFGTDITWLVEKGLVIVGEFKDQNVGEIVVKTKYWEENLKGDYTSPRSFVSGLVNSDDLSEASLKALVDGAVEFVIFDSLENAVEVPFERFRTNFTAIEDHLLNIEYPTDGVIFEVKNAELRSLMGSNSHHHNYMLAKKKVGDIAETVVESVTFQTGKSGVITPVLEIKPVVISGSTISRVTASNCRKLLDKRVGAGAKVAIVKSGEVIPFLYEILVPVEPELIDACPCCHQPLIWSETGVNLLCTNDYCGSRIRARIAHHFKTIKCKGFGEVVVDKLVDGGYTMIERIYGASQEDLVQVGISSGVAKNLIAEMERVRAEQIGDYLVLGSLGISDLGRGASKKLLAEYKLDEVSFLAEEKIQAIPQFGALTASKIAEQLIIQSPMIEFLVRSFNVEHTQDVIKQAQEVQSNSSHPLAGIEVVFTGTCSMSRGEMNKHAESLGAIAAKRVTNTTGYLICGDKTGATKIAAAEKKGVQCISEEEYFAM